MRRKGWGSKGVKECVFLRWIRVLKDCGGMGRGE